jgi:hypothetical protein
MRTKSKHIQQRQQQAANLKEQVLKVLQWGEQTYCDHQYNTGLAYLNYYIPTDAMWMEFLVRSKIFWNWWKNKWAERDQAFMVQVGGAWEHVKVSTLVELYLQLNDPYELSHDCKPHGVVLTESYARMMQEVIDYEIVPQKD